MSPTKAESNGKPFDAPPDDERGDERGDAWEPPSLKIGLPILSCADLLYTCLERRPAVIDGLPATPPEQPWTAKRFAETFGQPEPQTRAAILESATLLGLSDRKAKELLQRAIENDFLFAWREGGAATKMLVATTRPTDPPPRDTAPLQSN